MIRIGTRDSELALWQAKLVQELLQIHEIPSELVLIKSDGDIDLVTPLYALGVQGIFTKTLDAALLSGKIDVAVHSMKDVPVQLAQGIVQASVLKRASYRDIFVPKSDTDFLLDTAGVATIATSSVRRKAQWLRRYPNHLVEPIRGNVNTRLRKVQEGNWHGAVFAAAGVERINLRPQCAVDLDWMLPAPAQGAIMMVCRDGEKEVINAGKFIHDDNTAICVTIERDFLRTLMGGCSAPVSALAEIQGDSLRFQGNVLSLDGKEIFEMERNLPLSQITDAGKIFAEELLAQGADKLMAEIRHAGGQG